MKVYLETMGCQMNRLDSELVMGALRAAGHEMVDDDRAADVLLYNTCSVRAQAENKVYSRLGTATQRKQHRPRLIVGVLGCMAQREGQGLCRRYGVVDILCSPNRLDELPALIEAAARGQRSIALDQARLKQPGGHAESQDANAALADQADSPAMSEQAALEAAPESILPSDYLDLSRDPSATPSAYQAYVRVMRGCDKFCSYCIVPFVRGGESCRDPGHIVQEAQRLVDAGRTEITLLGQTVNRYTWRGNGGSVRFSDLLAMVAAVRGLRRLRFVTSHPLDFGDDILQAMRDLPNVCPYIHVPAQSGSDAVLKRMNRRYSRAEYDDFIDRARAIVPGVVLAGDFIVGFPGETPQDHQASADLIRRSAYKNSFIFKYSPRPGTAAARSFRDDVPMAVKRQRNNELLAVQDEVGLAHHRSFIGRDVEVLVEGPSPRAAKQPVPHAPGMTQLVGRTTGDHVVVFDGATNLAGQYMAVTITDATALTLSGVIRTCPTS